MPGPIPAKPSEYHATKPIPTSSATAHRLSAQRAPRGNVDESPGGHIRHDLSRCFELHRNLMEQGAMQPGVEVGA